MGDTYIGLAYMQSRAKKAPNGQYTYLCLGSGRISSCLLALAYRRLVSEMSLKNCHRLRNNGRKEEEEILFSKTNKHNQTKSIINH